jgi:carbon monoxide dehydrogenase subunit G
MVVRESITIAAPPERVWAVVMDPQCLSKWVTIHRSLGTASPAPLGTGDEIEQTLTLRGMRMHVNWTVTELDENRRAVWDGKGPARARARSTYEFRPDGDGTRFDYEMEFHAPLGPLGSAANRVLVGTTPAREARASLKKLKALVED